MPGQSHQSGLQKMVGHGSIYAAGSILRQLVGFLMLPVYTRCLSPAEYGVVGLMTFALSLIELFFGARLSQAVPKYYFDYKEKKSKNAIVSTAMLITFGVSCITTLGIIIFRSSCSNIIFGTRDFAGIVGLFAILILTQAQEYYGLTYIRLKQRPWLFVGINLAKLIVQLSLNIWLVVYLERGVMGVAVSAMASSAFFAFLLTVFTLRQVGIAFDTKLAKRMVLFCWPLWLAGLANLYLGSSNRYFIRVFGTLDDVGLYELAAKFSVVISYLIWSSFAQYWQVERFRYYERGNAEPIFQMVFRCLSTILIAVALGIAIFSRPVIQVMADSPFHNAFVAVPFLSFAAVFNCLTMFLNFSFHVTEQTGWISRNSYFAAVIATFFYFLLIPQYGFAGAAVALMIAQGARFILVHCISKRFYDMGVILTPTMGMFVLSWCAIGVVHTIYNKHAILYSVLIDFIIYFCVCICLFCALLRNKDVRSTVMELLTRIRMRHCINGK